MASLADFKRALTPGRKIRLVEWFGKPRDDVRTVRAVGSKDIQLVRADGQVTHLEIPKSSLLDFDGKNITIYEPGLRPLTAAEQAVMDGQPRDEKQEYIDAISDGSQMYHRRAYYFKQSGMEYLWSNQKLQGKRLKHVRGQVRTWYVEEAKYAWGGFKSLVRAETEAHLKANPFKGASVVERQIADDILMIEDDAIKGEVALKYVLED